MIDIHTHILPGIDDGSSSIEETMSMLNLMEMNGVRVCVATPHFDFSHDNEDEFLSKRSDALRVVSDSLGLSNLSIEIKSGCELMFTPQLANVDLSPFVIEGTDYVLIELSTKYDDPLLQQTFELILGSGYIPILAHVERYSYLIEDSQRIVDLINQGVVVQVNAKSINDSRFPFVHALFKHNLVHVIGSDAHNMSSRKPNVIKNLVSDSINENANSILSNELIDFDNPSRIKKIFNKYI